MLCISIFHYLQLTTLSGKMFQDVYISKALYKTAHQYILICAFIIISFGSIGTVNTTNTKWRLIRACEWVKGRFDDSTAQVSRLQKENPEDKKIVKQNLIDIYNPGMEHLHILAAKCVLGVHI